MVNEGRIREEQFKLLFPEGGNPNIDDWDLALLVKIIKNLLKGSLTNQQSNDFREILDFRNDIVCHVTTKKITINKQAFNFYWERLTRAINRLAQTFDSETRKTFSDMEKRLKTGPLDLKLSVEKLVQINRTEECMRDVMDALKKITVGQTQLAEGIVSLNTKADSTNEGIVSLNTKADSSQATLADDDYLDRQLYNFDSDFDDDHDEVDSLMGHDDLNDEVYFGKLDGTIVGLQYYSRTVNPNECVALERDPKNRYDFNAIKVKNVGNTQVGHIKRDLAQPLAFIVDKGLARIEGIVPSGMKNQYSLQVELSLWGKPENYRATADKLKSCGYYLMGVEGSLPGKPGTSSSSGASAMSSMGPAPPIRRYLSPSETPKHKGVGYREGPQALGSKEIPEGADNCLEGLTFVITGVLESFERDESKSMVERYGGKVKTVVSKRTDYLVLGREPGQSKIAKAESFKTEQIDEDALLELIRTRPGKKSKYVVNTEEYVKKIRFVRRSNIPNLEQAIDIRKQQTIDVDRKGELLEELFEKVEAMAITKDVEIPSTDKSKSTAENKIQINNASEESIREIPGLDQQSAQQILLFRKEYGNVTPELLLLINSKLTKEDLERIDFARNNQKFTANQEKHLGKDDTTCGGSEKADTALGGNIEDKDGTPLGGSEEGKDGTTHRGREEGKYGTALGGSEEGKDDYTFPKEDKDQNKNKIRINFADVKSIMIIPGLDQNWAEKILLFRTGHGHVTHELLSYIQPTLSKEEMAKIDFTPYTHQCTDYQEDHVKDEMTRECTAEDDWGICLKNFDIEGIWELLKGGKIPPYKTFLRTVDKLSTQTDKLRDFCRIVSNNLKKTIPNAKIVYSARNPKNDDIAFVVLSTNPSDQQYIGGYPVKMKYAYGHCNEDFTIRNMERKEDLCFKSTEEEKEINAAVRSSHDLFSEWPNYSRTSFSFYKSSRFNEENSKMTLIEKGCIVLFVFLKHWIPVGWGSFPDRSREYEIDVRQSMLVRKHTFAMPTEVAFSRAGTVQGSIKHVGNNKIFALTAAHVVLNGDEVHKPRRNLQVYTEDDLRDVVFSRPDLHFVSVKKAALGGLWHVDVALLELSERLPRKNIEFDWTEHGFTRQPRLTSSCFETRKPAHDDIVIKYGMTTGITIGTVRCINASFPNETGFFEIAPWQPEKTQSPGPADSGSQASVPGTSGLPSPQSGDSGSPASVPGTSGLPFSQDGDSGSLVFVVNKDIRSIKAKDGSNFESDLALVGMVNMGEDGICWATHIDATMVALGKDYTFDE